MAITNLKKAEIELEKKFDKKGKRKKTKMKVSGKGVKDLQRIILEKLK